MSKTNEIYCNLVLFSIGRISEKWSLDTGDGLVYANDPSTLGSSKSTVFTIIFKKDEDGELTGEKIFLIDGGTHEFSADQEDYQKDLVKKLTNIKPWEKEIISNFIHESEYGSDFYLDAEQGKISIGEGGEIRIEEIEKNKAAGSLVFNATFYQECIGKIEKSAPYGFDWGDCKPDDSSELCAIVWSPSSEIIEKSLNEAEDYKNKSNNSLNLYLNIIETWQSIETEGLAKAWQTILTELPKDFYIWSHTKAARLALDVLGDQELYRKLINDAKKMTASGKIDYVSMAICVSQELSRDIDANRIEIMELMNEAVERASAESEEDICSLIEFIADKNSGSKLGDINFAKNAIEKVISRTTDSKIKTKIKKKAEKKLQNYL